MMKHLADASLGQIGGEGLGPFGNISDGSTGLVSLTKIISAVIGMLTVVAGIWFLVQFLLGGFSWISAGGDKAKLQGSRDKLTNAFIGLIVVVASYSILALAGTFFGIDFTISDPAGLLNRLSPQ